jgi:hypothetical protein
MAQPNTLASVATAVGESVASLLLLSREDLVELLKDELGLKVMARNAIIQEWQTHQDSGGLPLAALQPGDGAAGGQGGRVAAGLGPIAPMGSVAALFVEHVRAPTPAFLDTIAPIAAANCIPGVMNMAQVTFATATDAKTYGALKGDPLSIESIAFIMKYSAEDSQPPIYRDMNNKCYDKDRSKITPFGSYMVGLVRHMEGIEPYPNIAVFRGVKADLSADYVKVSPVAWAVAADGWHVGLEGVWFV